jgi:2'-5' RNA ligase
MATVITADLRERLTWQPNDVTITSGELTAAGATTVHSGAMVALVPSDADLDRLAEVATEPRDELHLTLFFLGDAASIAPDDRARITQCVTMCADQRAAVEANVFGAAVWNPDSPEPALVLSVGGETLDEVHAAVESALSDVEVPEQHVPWVPHVTLAYDPAPDLLNQALALVGPITFDRLRVAFGGETTDVTLYRSTGAVASGSLEAVTMPYEVRKGDGCPPGKPFGVFKKGTSERLGCHPTRADAEAQQAALYANEEKADVSGDTLVDDVIVPLATDGPMPPSGTMNPMMGGKPTSGTPADKRLKRNQTYEVDETGDANLTEMSGTPWQGILVMEGVETGDGRVFAEGSLTWDQPPLPIRWTPTDEGQHKGAVLVARADNIWRDETNPSVIRGEGIFDDHGINGAEALRLVRNQFLKGVSVDVDSVKDADVELVFPTVDADVEADGDQADILTSLFQAPETTIFHAGRIRAATLCDIPAFTEAQIWLTDGTMTVVAAAATVNPPTAGFADLDRLFAHNCRGDVNITACAVGVSALLRDAKLPISLARRRSMYDHLAAHLQSAGLTPQAFDPVNFSTELTALVAGLVPQDTEAPPAAWFTNPELTEPTPLTVTDDGRILGHGALWNSCHTGFANACVAPPREGAHTYFRQGELVTLEGHHIAVGHITLGTGHAPTYGVDSRQALEHYDNTGSVVADVISGEDQFGIWVAGALRPGLSPARVRELRGAKLSGDWRRIGGQLRLVAFLAVNVPGFPVPRLRAEVDAGRQLSLVASGIMRGNELEEREQAAQRAALDNIRTRLQRRLGLTPAERAQQLRLRVLGSDA